MADENIWPMTANGSASDTANARAAGAIPVHGGSL
jgi:hypothetical protein